MLKCTFHAFWDKIYAMKFPIPGTYSEILNSLDDDTFLSFRRCFSAADPMSSNLFEDQPNKEGVINSFVDRFTSASFMKGLPDHITRNELQTLRKIIVNGGSLWTDEKQRYPEESMIDVLIERGLVFRIRDTDKDGITVPLEICLGLPFDKDEESRSLLRAMNRYSSDIIKLMASHLGISHYGKLHKIRLAALVYRRIVETYSNHIGALTGLQKEIIRTIFRHGGVISNGDLGHWAKANGMKESEYSSWYGHNHFLYYLSTSFRRNEKHLSDLEKALLSPILSGVLCVSYRETYDYRWNYFIPGEVFPLLAEDFFREMDEKRDAIRKTMHAVDPDSFISYSGRIVEDMIKVQIAAVCGLVESVKSKPEFKRRSLTHIAGMLQTDDRYVERLLRLIASYPGRLKDINYDSFDLIKRHVLRYDHNAALLAIIKSIDGWVHTDGLVKYLMNHRGLYQYSASLSENGIEELLKDSGLLGLLDISPDNKKLKTAPFLSMVLGAHSVKPPSTVKAGARPLIVQPNLELLIPFNTEMKALQKLSGFSDLTILDRMLHFTLSKKSLIRGLDAGWDTRRILYFLSSISSKDIPKTVQNFIETCLHKQGEASVLPSSALIRCRGLGLKEKILSIKGLGAAGLDSADDYLHVTGLSHADAVKILKKNGIFAELSLQENPVKRRR
jgi:hypothetical protein